MYRRMIHRRYRARRYAVLLLALGVVLGLTWAAYRYHRQVYAFFLRDRAYDSLIQAAGRRHDLDPDLIRAVIWQESRFNANATGSSGEVGLMQIRVERGAVAEWAILNRRTTPPRSTLYHPALNVDIGTWYLARAMRRWQGYEAQVALALAEYNAGEKGANWQTVAPDPAMPTEVVIGKVAIASTREYVRAITERYHDYCQHREAEE